MSLKDLKVKNSGYLLYNLKPLKDRRYAILCLDCGWMRISWGVHDYRVCPCPNGAMVDGGIEYLRAGAKDLKRIQVVEVRPKKEKEE